MSKDDIDLIWEKINCEACYMKNINYCKEKCECKCKEFKALENILSQLQELGEINFRLLNNGVPKEEFDELRLKLKKEKNKNEANKKRIEELEKQVEYDKTHIFTPQTIELNYISKSKIIKKLKEKEKEYKEVNNSRQLNRKAFKNLLIAQITVYKELLKDGGE